MKMKTDYTKRSATTRNYQLKYKLEFTTGVYGEVTGRILYQFRDGTSSPMTWGSVDDVRGAWHSLCRLNRARVSGRDYRHIIEHLRIRQRA